MITWASCFFELDESLDPIKVITGINTNNKFNIETTGMNDNIPGTLRDISYINGNNIPELEFEI